MNKLWAYISGMVFLFISFFYEYERNKDLESEVKDSKVKQQDSASQQYITDLDTQRLSDIKDMQKEQNKNVSTQDLEDFFNKPKP